MPVFNPDPLELTAEFPPDYAFPMTLSAIEILLLECLLTPACNRYLWQSITDTAWDDIERATASLQEKLFEVV